VTCRMYECEFEGKEVVVTTGTTCWFKLVSAHSTVRICGNESEREEKSEEFKTTVSPRSESLLLPLFKSLLGIVDTVCLFVCKNH